MSEETLLTPADIFAKHGMSDQAIGDVLEIEGSRFNNTGTMVQVNSTAGKPIGLCVELTDTTAVMPQLFCMFPDGTTRSLAGANYHVVEPLPPSDDPRDGSGGPA